MAESGENSENDVISANDPLDINELASLNEEISNDFIEQLQNKISKDSNIKNDGDLFEDPADESEQNSATFNKDLDDNFIKKYKAKLNKKNRPNESEPKPVAEQTPVDNNVDTNIMTHAVATNEPDKTDKVEISNSTENIPDENTTVKQTDLISQETQTPVQNTELPAMEQENNNSIEAVSGGNITERLLDNKTIEYNDSLNYLDSNKKYSKYVIYIDPENKDFIDSLTIKERKNLINRIIKDQDAIAVTKRNFGKIQTLITHAIVAILTVTIAVPCIYWAINASLEATINNYRASQTVFGKLYKEHGKIKTNNTNRLR